MLLALFFGNAMYIRAVIKNLEVEARIARFQLPCAFKELQYMYLGPDHVQVN